MSALKRCVQLNYNKSTSRTGDTDDEWAIIIGLLEGAVACHHMPAFINQVLNNEERLHLYSTIQPQVEGELISFTLG